MNTTGCEVSHAPGMKFQPGIGDIDLFYAESKEYAERLQQAGVATIFDIVPDAPHGFEVFGDGSELVADYFKRHFVAVRELIDAA